MQTSAKSIFQFFARLHFLTQYKKINLYVKSDFSTSKGLMEILKQRGLINLDTLYMDEYGVLFNEFKKEGNNIFVNYLPCDNTYSQALRISHDGYVSGCIDMFYDDYRSRAIGNITHSPIRQILQNWKNHTSLPPEGKQ